MNFNVTYDSTITNQSPAFQAMFETAVNAVIEFFEHAFTNNVTVNVTFSWQNLGGGFAAENFFSDNTFTYSQIKTALINSEGSADDIAAYTTLPVDDPTGSNLYALTLPEARALGLSTETGQPDDLVILNSALAWTFDPNHRAVPGAEDAIGAMEHEITEGVFGRIASLAQSPFPGAYTALDLFRYSSPGVRDFDPNHADFFSIDGTHLLTRFNDWFNGHNGADLGDWFPTVIGDSFGDLYTGTTSLVTPTDLRELDILGWGRAPATSHDFNGDAVSDILFVNSSTGGIGEFEMNPGEPTHPQWIGLGGYAAGWQVVGSGDFNGDRSSDILLFNSSTGGVGEFQMTNGQASWVGLGGIASGWTVAGTGDFNGDGTSDILFFNSSTGGLGEFQMHNGQASWVGFGGIASGWTAAGIGDFNGDGTSDILFFNSSTGGLGEFQMQNGQASWVGFGGIASGWTVAGTGDFNGDGTSDILFFNSSTGGLGEFQMHNGQAAWVGLGGIASGWTVAGIGDFNGDGMSDILFSNSSTGAIGEFQMHNDQPTWLSIGGISTGWHIVT